MPTIIDGYNLLHASGILGRGRGPGYFERSRTALLNFLAEALPPDEVAATTVVFDAAAAPSRLARTLTHRGLTVHFARDRASADELIGELIRASTSPTKLTVVSSDHAVQRAARRRRATAIDSDEWLARARQARRQRPPQAAPPPADAARDAALTCDQVDYWLRAFGLVGESQPVRPPAAAERSAAGESGPPNAGPATPSTSSPAVSAVSQPTDRPPVPNLATEQRSTRRRGSPDRPPRDRPIVRKQSGEVLFPPGYADDVGDEP